MVMMMMIVDNYDENDNEDGDTTLWTYCGKPHCGIKSSSVLMIHSIFLSCFLWSNSHLVAMLFFICLLLSITKPIPIAVIFIASEDARLSAPL